MTDPTPALFPLPMRTFKVHACIGRGGYGEVYLASVHEGTGPPTRVALKVLHGNVDPLGEAVLRLRDERRILGALDHPAILRVHELAVLAGRVALVTEYVDGEDLSAVIQRAPLPRCAALELGMVVADALDAASKAHNAQGQPLALVHRDVKPSNLRIARDGQVKLLDFGVARADGLEREANTATDIVLGSLPYMAPELLTGVHASHASDVYALGCTLAEAMLGERLLRQREPELIALLLHDERFTAFVVERLRAIPDPEVAGWLGTLVAWDPEHRPALADVRDRARVLYQGAGPGLGAWCGTRRWLAPTPLAGVLAGRVLHEQRVDPRTAGGATLDGLAVVDPAAQVLTVLVADGRPITHETPPPPPRVSAASLPARAAPPPSVPTLASAGTSVARPGRPWGRWALATALGLGAAVLLPSTFVAVYFVTMALLRGLP